MSEKNGLILPEASATATKQEELAEAAAEAEELQQLSEHLEKLSEIDETRESEGEIDETPECDSNGKESLLAELFFKHLQELVKMILTGHPENLSGEERVEQEKRMSKFRNMLEGPIRKVVETTSPEGKKQMAEDLLSAMPASMKGRAVSALKIVNIIETEDPNAEDPNAEDPNA